MASGSVHIRKEVLDDISCRFIINLPEEEKIDIMKVCDHLETAYWFYLDFLRPDDHTLPACNFEEFLTTILRHCSVRIPNGLTTETLVTQWKSRKYKKPVRGAIILNNDYTKCLLVQGYPASSSWGFPKGKMNEGEKSVDAAVREVYEEVGFDIRAFIKEDQFIEIQQSNGQSAGMFIIHNIPEDTEFSPRARNEIKDIQWFKIKDLPSHRRDTVSRNNLKMSPNKFFLIIPFISKLKRYISRIKQRDEQAVEQAVVNDTVDNSYHSDYHGNATYNVLLPVPSWNNFELNIESIIKTFRQK